MKDWSALQRKGKKAAERFRKDMKTQEAHRLQESVDLLKEQVEELGSLRAAESYLTYFTRIPWDFWSLPPAVQGAGSETADLCG